MIDTKLDKPDIKSTAVIDITSEEQFEQLRTAATGPMLVDFTSLDCGYCEEDKPKVDALAERCVGTTVLRVNCEAVPSLADRFNVDGTPTLLYAKTGALMVPGKAKEVDPAGAARKLKCSRAK